MRRILVVPHALFEELSTSFLDRRSFSMRAAASAEEALAATAVWLPALIIFDSELPDSSAADFCLAVRMDMRLHATKLLMLTSVVPSDEAPRDLTEADADAHLLQPVPQEELLRAVGLLLDVETRRAPRLAVELLARVSVDGTDESMVANILRLSSTSLRIECENQLSMGTVITIQFVLPEANQFALKAVVLVADSLQLHYGCEFVGLDADQTRDLREYVDRNESGVPPLGGSGGLA